MRIFITGGTGFVGSYLTRRFTDFGHEVTVITRSVRSGQALPQGAVFLEGNPGKPGPWQKRVAEHDVIINLAGRSIFSPWTAKVRREILESRVLTTRNVVEALKAGGEGKLLLSTSAVGYYGNSTNDSVLDESSPPGDGFLAEVGKAWEEEARRGEQFGARVVRCRFGIVLGRDGGALETMVPAFRYYLASPLGSGRQWFPWIHLEDIFGIMSFVGEHPNLSGPINCTAPQPVRNREFTEVLAKALKKWVILPAVPAFLLRTLLGEFGSVLLDGQRAFPKRLLDSGYDFRFPTLEQALRDLIGNKR
jgi:uncharacterized protein